MPELPEVETMVRDLTPRVTGHIITHIDAPFRGSIIWPDYTSFVARVAGRAIERVSRRGKYAIFHLDSGDVLVLHRGMSGSLLLRAPAEIMEPHVRLRLDLDSGQQLRFNDPRKFGKVYVMESDGTERPLPWAAMGPEPLDGDFTADTLREALHGRTGLLKPLLLGQRIVAGLGNIYVDEALFEAGIHPERRAGTLDPGEIERLHTAIRDVLARAVERRGTTFNNYTDIEGRAGQYQDSLRVFHRAGSPGPRCGDTIIRTVVGGRGTHTCSTCQRM